MRLVYRANNVETGMCKPIMYNQEMADLCSHCGQKQKQHPRVDWFPL